MTGGLLLVVVEPGQRVVEERVPAFPENVGVEVRPALVVHDRDAERHVGQGAGRRHDVPVGELVRPVPGRLLPAPQHLVGGGEPEHQGRVEACPAQVDARCSGTGAVPVDQARAAIARPEGVPVPQVAVHEHAPAGGHGKPVEVVVGGRQQRGGALRATLGREVDVRYRPGPQRQRVPRCQRHRLQSRGQSPQTAQPPGGGDRRDPAVPGQDRGQHGQGACRGTVEIGGDQPCGGQPVRTGHLQCRHLGGEPLTVVGVGRVTEPQHGRLDPAGRVEPHQPRVRALPQTGDGGHPDAASDRADHPAQDLVGQLGHRHHIPRFPPVSTDSNPSDTG